MAPPSDVNQNIPETLPADFGEWDMDESVAPNGSQKVESPAPVRRDSAVKGAAAREFVPREAAPKNPAPREAAGLREVTRGSESGRNTAPIPRSAVPMPNHRNYGTPSSTGQRVVSMPQATPSYPDDETFFRRIRSLNTVVDKLSPTEQPKEEKASAAVAAVTAIQDPPVEEEPRIQAEEEPSIARHTDLSKSEDEEERGAQRKWIAIIAVCVGLVVLITFRLLHSGTVSMVQHMVVPETSAVASSAQPDANPAAEPFESRPLAASKSAESAQAQRREDTQQSTDHQQAAPAEAQTKMMHDQLFAPTRIPHLDKVATSNDAPPVAGLGGASMAALGGGAPATNVFSGSGKSNAPDVMLKPVNVSAGIAVGMLLHRTQPIYPSIAKAARVSGTVVIQATISKTGTVVNPHVVSGPQMLRQAALDAVKTWRYRPYTLNNEPTEVETTVDVIFALAN